MVKTIFNKKNVGVGERFKLQVPLSTERKFPNIRPTDRPYTKRGRRTGRPRGYNVRLRFTGAWHAGWRWRVPPPHSHIRPQRPPPLDGGLGGKRVERRRPGGGGDGANWPRHYLSDTAVRN